MDRMAEPRAAERILAPARAHQVTNHLAERLADRVEGVLKLDPRHERLKRPELAVRGR